MKVFLLALLFAPLAQAGVSFTAVPPGVAPYDFTLTWSSTPDVVSCQASGAWSGAKDPSGSQLITAAMTDRTFKLTCATTLPITVQLTCTAPTTNTDNSPLTNIAGYRTQNATTFEEVPNAPRIQYPGQNTVFTISGIAPGLNHFGARTYTTTGAESYLSNIVSKTFAPTTVSASLTVVVGARPRAPICQTVS